MSFDLDFDDEPLREAMHLRAEFLTVCGVHQ
jgi:hypothetical protein